METLIERLVKMALEEDLDDRGDVTSNATIPADQQLRGRIVAKKSGVIAGLIMVEEVYRQIDAQVVVTPHVQDGDSVSEGTVVAEIVGAGRSLLIGERVSLNFL